MGQYTNPASRPRIQGGQTTGGLARIMQGLFGVGSPASQLSSPAEVLGNAPGFYSHHEGDLFTPGTGNWVLDPSLETPLNTQWGNAFLRVPNTFSPFPGTPQVYANPATKLVGIGGPIAGQLITAPLSEYGGQ